MMSPLALLPLVILATTIFVDVESKRNASLDVDISYAEYISLEKALWQYVTKPRITREAQLKKVYDAHQKFARDKLQQTFDDSHYNIIQHYEWVMLKMDLIHVDRIFEAFRQFLNTNEKSGTYDERAALDLCDNVLRNDSTFSMDKIFTQIHLVMVKQTMYYRAMMNANQDTCNIQQSPQQFLYSLYTDVALIELKGYAMMQFSWMMLKIYGKGNFIQESNLMRENYAQRIGRSLKLLREVMKRSDRTLWRCDPQKYVRRETFDEVTRLIQGYIENEVDMNEDGSCREDCNAYDMAKNYGCYKNQYCSRQKRCTGQLLNCQYFDADMWICPSPLNSTRRYEYIEYEDGRILGQKRTCFRGTTKVDSWWRFVVRCSYCFCMCDEEQTMSDRYFNLRRSLSNVAENKVITGLRFVKRKRVFHIQIQEGQLLPLGKVNQSSVSWVPLEDYQIFDPYVNRNDFHTLKWNERAIDIDDIEGTDFRHVVTGIRFRRVGVHLNLEAQMSEYDFESGKLVSPMTSSFWQSNDNTDVYGTKREQIKLKDPDIPTRTLVKSLPTSKHNQFIEFTHSSIYKDAAQTTVPFIDIQDVTSNPAVPLSGVGIYHKGRTNYGGFIAPKIITYNLTPHVQLPSSGTK